MLVTPYFYKISYDVYKSDNFMNMRIPIMASSKIVYI